MKKFTVTARYKMEAKFDIKAKSQQEAQEIADNMDYPDFMFHGEYVESTMEFDLKEKDDEC